MKKHLFILGGGVVAIALAAGLGNFIYKNVVPRTIEQVTIKDKERVCSTVANCRYMFYTDKGVYENTDAWLFLKTNSADYYGNIDVNTTYNLKVVGVRFSLFSWQPNIINYEKVN